jgi:hypothetical protein
MTTVNEHLIHNIHRLKGAYGTRPVTRYKRFNKRVNFLLRIHRIRGRNHPLSMGEINRGRLDVVREGLI